MGYRRHRSIWRRTDKLTIHDDAPLARLKHWIVVSVSRYMRVDTVFNAQMVSELYGCDTGQPVNGVSQLEN